MSSRYDLIVILNNLKADEMSGSMSSKSTKYTEGSVQALSERIDTSVNAMAGHKHGVSVSQSVHAEMLTVLSFLEDLCGEVEDTIELASTDAHLRMALHLLQGHFEARTVTPTSLIGASGVPYATANRRMKDMMKAGLIDQRPRTKTRKSFSLHPSDKLLSQWVQLSGRVQRIAEGHFGGLGSATNPQDYYFGGRYAAAQ